MECKEFLIEFQNYLKESSDEDFENVINKLNDVLFTNRDMFVLSDYVENLSCVQFSQNPHYQANKDLERLNEFNYTALDVSDTSGDGFFDSLSVCLFGNTLSNAQLRFKTLDYMCQNFDSLFHVRKNLDYSLSVEETILACSNAKGFSNVLTFWCASKALDIQIVNVYPPYNGICDKKFNFMPRVFSPDRFNANPKTCFLLWFSSKGIEKQNKILPLVPKSDFNTFGDHIYCSKSNTAKVQSTSKRLQFSCKSSDRKSDTMKTEINVSEVKENNSIINSFEEKIVDNIPLKTNYVTQQCENQSLSCLAEILTSNKPSKRTNDGLFGLPLTAPKQMHFLNSKNITPFSTPNTMLLSLDAWNSNTSRDKENEEQKLFGTFKNNKLCEFIDDLVQSPLNTQESFKDQKALKQNYKDHLEHIPNIPELHANVNNINVPYREFQSKDHLIDYMLNTPCTHTFLPQHAPQFEQFLVPKSQIEFSKFCGPWTRLRHHKTHSKKYAGVWVMVSHFVHSYCGSKYRKIVSKLSTGKMLYQFEGECPDYIKKMQTYSSFAQKTAADTLLNSTVSTHIKSDLSNCHVIVEGDVDSLYNLNLLKGCRFILSTTRNYQCVVENLNGNYNAFLVQEVHHKSKVARLTQRTYSSNCCEFYKRIVFTIEGCCNTLVQFVGKKPQKCHCEINNSPVPYW